MEARLALIFCFLTCVEGVFANNGDHKPNRQRKNFVVQRGSEAAIRSEHLQINSHGSVVCRLEVVHDPICMRFGNLTSQGFTCDLNSSNEVLYLHSGSSLSSVDCIKLKVLVFFEDRTATQIMKINVLIENGPDEELLSVPETSVHQIGGKAMIGKEVLPPLVKTYHTSCSVAFQASNEGWPANGKFMMSSSHVNSSCTDFNATYTHDGSYIPNVDYIPIILSWIDGTGKFKQKRYQLKVRIQGAQKNDPPVVYSRRPRTIVKQYSVTQMKLTNIRAIDYKTDPSKLLLKIARPQREDLGGYFSTVEDPDTPLEAVTQSTIDKGKLLYIAPKKYQVRGRPFFIQQFQVQAIDMYGAVSKKKLRILFFVQKFVPYYLSVVNNKPLRVLEGKTCKVTADVVDILCPGSNCNRAKFSVIGEPKHGGILRNGRKINEFMFGDLQDGDVIYKHDNSENLVDNIVLSIMEQTQLAFVTLNVIVEPIDDAPPFLSVHKDITARNGQLTKIDPKVLRASDPDSSIDDIMFRLVEKPNRGTLKREEKSSFITVDEFTEVELENGLIYYSAQAKEPSTDWFVFILTDKKQNLSKRYTARVRILAADTIPPHKRQGGDCLARMKETDASISLSFIDYVDNVSPSKDISIRILDQKHPDREYVKHKDIVRKIGYEMFPASTFTQQELFHHKVLYLNNYGEIGVHAKNLRLDFVVSDRANNTTPIESCTIVIEPVDNRAPLVSILGKITVHEGGRVCLNGSDILMTDTDSVIKKVRFKVNTQPRYGYFSYVGGNITKDDSIQYLEFERGCLWYQHDGSETTSDTFRITASDGVNQREREIKIGIKPVNDQRPRFVEKSVELHVMENSSVVIGSSSLKAVDGDSTTSSFIFHVVEGPKLGYLQTKNINVTKFSQNDVDDNLLMYTHISKEIGPYSIFDNFRISVCDLPQVLDDCVSILQVRVEIYPINSSPPTLLLGSDVSVKEGGTAMIGRETLKCMDKDTIPKNIRIRILTYPKYGYLENTAPSVGSEKSNAGLHISEFVCSDLDEGSVNYVQNNHSGFEPQSDSFRVIAFDGAFNTTPATVRIKIIPTNDEGPIVQQIAPIKAQEGGWVIVNKEQLAVTDKDIPQDVLKIYVTNRPAHGQMFYKCNGAGSPMLQRLPAKSPIDYLHCAMIYVHDDSETTSDKLHIEATDGKMVSKATVHIGIIPVNDKKPELLKNIMVTVRFGGFKNISRSYLVAQDLDTDTTELRYRVTKLPSYGSLKLYRFGLPTRLLLNGTFTQDDVDKQRISYVSHIMPVSGLTDAFKFSLSDGVHTVDNQTFVIRIRLSCRKHFKIKTTDVMSNGPRIFITSSHIRVQRRSTSGKKTVKGITFHIIRQPKHGVLSLDATEKGQKVTIVTEDDLKERRLVYRPFEYPRKTNDTFKFLATDGKCMQRGKIQILTIDTNIAVDLMKRVSPLNVAETGTTSVTPLEIRSVDKLSTEKVVYRIKTLPKHGIMLKDGVNTSQFSQKDINELRISYLLLDERAKQDDINIEVFVQDYYGLKLNSKPERFLFNVNINLPNVGKVRSITNEPITALENLGQNKIGTVIRKQNLLFFDCSSSLNSNLTYVVIEPPVHGELIFKDSGRQATKFTQGDINREKVIYQLTDQTYTDSSDSLILDVESKGCHKLSGVEFSIRWSIVSLSEMLKVECKNGRTSITVRLTRFGYLDQGSVVELHTRSLPDGVEAISPERIWFQPGDTEKLWRMPEEALEYEKVEIYINKEFNTLLRRTRIVFDIAKTQDACSLEREKNRKDFANVTAESSIKADPSINDQFHAISLVKTPATSRDLRSKGEDSAHLDLTENTRKFKGICSKGWVGFGNNCYFSSKKAANWKKAKKFCKKKTAYLFTPSSVMEEAVVRRIKHQSAFWIGIRLGKKNNWKWNINTLSRLFLRKLRRLALPKRPSDNLCVYVDIKGEWRLNNCKEKTLSFVCKMPKKQ